MGRLKVDLKKKTALSLNVSSFMIRLYLLKIMNPQLMFFKFKIYV